jgi:hypothetical protein
MAQGGTALHMQEVLEMKTPIPFTIPSRRRRRDREIPKAAATGTTWIYSSESDEWTKKSDDNSTTGL